MDRRPALLDPRRNVRWQRGLRICACEGAQTGGKERAKRAARRRPQRGDDGGQLINGGCIRRFVVVAAAGATHAAAARRSHCLRCFAFVLCSAAVARGAPGKRVPRNLSLRGPTDDNQRTVRHQANQRVAHYAARRDDMWQQRCLRVCLRERAQTRGQQRAEGAAW